MAASSRNGYCCAVLAGLPSRHKLSHYADKEANPLYPVPVLMNAAELEPFYYMLMEEPGESSGAGFQRDRDADAPAGGPVGGGERGRKRSGADGGERAGPHAGRVEDQRGGEHRRGVHDVHEGAERAAGEVSELRPDGDRRVRAALQDDGERAVQRGGGRELPADSAEREGSAGHAGAGR